MTRAQKLTHLPTLSRWLTNNLHESEDGKYYHRKLEENLEIRTHILQELQRLMHQAHEDARQKLRKLTGIACSLDPLEEEETPGVDTSIIDDFPRYLELKTLKGYFGEIMAALVAENFNPLGEDWQVFAFPFRSHQMAYHALEKVRQEGGVAPTIIGRFGDDMLAFQCDDQGEITHVLFCEAKCTARHDPDLIAEAHKKSSDNKIIPADCLSLIEILQDNATTSPEAEKRVHALRHLWWSYKNPTHERCDLVGYICGLLPARASTVIIPTSQPHSDYTAERRLEAVELHLHDVDGLIEDAYQATIQPITCTLSEEELSVLWNKVVSYAPNPSQSLLMDHCSLMAFDGQKAIVSVRSLALFRHVQRKTRDIQDAFLSSGIFTSNSPNERINVRLKVSKIA